MASFLCCRVIRECSMKEELDKKKSDFSQCLCEEDVHKMAQNVDIFTNQYALVFFSSRLSRLSKNNVSKNSPIMLFQAFLLSYLNYEQLLCPHSQARNASLNPLLKNISSICLYPNPIIVFDVLIFDHFLGKVNTHVYLSNNLKLKY